MELFPPFFPSNCYVQYTVTKRKMRIESKRREFAHSVYIRYEPDISFAGYPATGYSVDRGYTAIRYSVGRVFGNRIFRWPNIRQSDIPFVRYTANGDSVGRIYGHRIFRWPGILLLDIPLAGYTPARYSVGLT